MKTFTNGVILVESISELPDLSGCTNLYLDLETTSGDSKLSSLNPWHNCDIAGLCVTTDDLPNAWYIPIGHALGNNLDYISVQAWVCLLLHKPMRWINHNIKYDAHVLCNEYLKDFVRGWKGVMPDHLELVDTLTLAKIKDSDRMSYALKNLSRDWLGEDIDKYEDALRPYLKTPKDIWFNKDYGKIPIEVMAEYGGQDVLTNRKLYHYLCDTIHQDCKVVARTEIELTRVIFEEERAGMCIDLSEILRERAKNLAEQLGILVELEELLGYQVRPSSPDDCYDLFCNVHGLPVIEWTDSDNPNPSFSKTALAKYRVYSNAPVEIIDLFLKYRKLETLYDMFLVPYAKLAVEHSDSHRLHPNFNQCVRTARRSCKNPNAMQLDSRAKALIHPSPGCSFLEIDYSQIEFRLICHYIGFTDAIDAYNDDPDMDYHAWVAELCGISRKPAKTVNFLIAFGGGKKMCLKKLEVDPDLTADLKGKAEVMAAVKGQKALYKWVDVAAGPYTTIKLQAYIVDNPSAECIRESLCAFRANEVFDTYHRELHMLKPFAKKATAVCISRGYIKNLYKRHRHLPRAGAYKAFNAIIQSSAADLQKERTVALYRALQSAAVPVKLLGSVHDSSLMEGPTEIIRDPLFIRDVMGIMEHPNCELSLPIRCSYGISDNNWSDASENSEIIVDGVKKSRVLNYKLEDCEGFRWLEFQKNESAISVAIPQAS